MTFQESIRTCFTKYVDFTGRAGLSEYWWFVLFTFIVSVMLSMFSESLGGLFSLVTLLPSIAVGTRRLHDINRSGWWQLLWFVPIIGWIVLVVFFAQQSKSETASL